MKLFDGSDTERQSHVKAMWEQQNKLLNNAQFLMKEGTEKDSVLKKMIESAMWLRLYMEIENIKPDIKVAIGTNPKENN